MGSGGHAHILQEHFDLDFPQAMVRVVGLSRTPGQKLPFGNITKPFSPLLWLLISFCLVSLSLSLFVAHALYERVSKRLVLKEEAKTNFLLFTFCKITEPEPLPWFRGGFGGRLLVFLWTTLSLLCTMFYVSNLRAMMVTTEYEKSIDTLEDVLTHGKKVWIPQAMTSLKYKTSLPRMQRYFLKIILLFLVQNC